MGIWQGFDLHQIRPFPALLFKLDWSLWQTDPFGYHLTNLVIHLATCVTVFWLARSLSGNSRTALLAGSLFAIAPTSSFDVSWITGRCDLLSALFCCLALLAFVTHARNGSKWCYAGSLAAFAIALGSKENAIALPVLLLAYLTVVTPAGAGSRAQKLTRVLRPLVPFLLLLSGYLLLRHMVFGSSGGEIQTAGQFARAFLSAQPALLRSLLFPSGPVRSLTNAYASGGLAIAYAVVACLIAALALARLQSKPTAREWRQVLFLGPVWYAATMFPVLFAGYVDVRHLYLSTAGSSICLAVVLAGGTADAGRYRRLALFAIVGIVALHCCCSLIMSREWLRSGQVSQSLHRDSIALLRTIPPGSTVFISIPPGGQTYLWNWALPYALLPPFANIYGAHRIVEAPHLFCCAPSKSFPHIKGDVLQRAVDQQQPVYALYWNARRDRLVLEQLPYPILLVVLRLVLPKAPASPITPDVASRLVDQMTAVANARSNSASTESIDPFVRQ